MTLQSLRSFFALAESTEARRAIIAKCFINGGQISWVGYLSCLINKHVQPKIFKNDTRGQQAFEYMDKVMKKTGLNTRYQ